MPATPQHGSRNHLTTLLHTGLRRRSAASPDAITRPKVQFTRPQGSALPPGLGEWPHAWSMSAITPPSDCPLVRG